MTVNRANALVTIVTLLLAAAPVLAGAAAHPAAGPSDDVADRAAPHAGAPTLSGGDADRPSPDPEVAAPPPRRAPEGAVAGAAGPPEGVAPSGVAGTASRQECEVQIIDETRPPDDSSRQDTKNVGQEIILRGEGEPAGGTYRWEIEPAIVREYDESVRRGWRVLGDDQYGVASQAGLDRLGIDGEGETNKVIYFFWDDTKTDYEGFDPDGRKTVYVTYSPPSSEDAVPGSGSSACTAQITFDIERNSDDPARQAVDFYTDCCWLAEEGVPESPGRVDQRWQAGNLPGVEEKPRDRVLVDHYRFHYVNTPPTHSVEAGGEPVHSDHAGVEFLAHHRVLVERFNAWREFFGYPRLGEYSGDGSIPDTDNGYDVTHDRRRTNRPDVSVPPWFTEDGDGSERPGGRSACRNAAGELVPDGGQQNLSDFESSGALGCALEHPWHNEVHGAIGRDMRSLTRSPKDPIFWRFHNYIAGIEQSPSVWRDWESVRARGPPGVSYTVPIRGTRPSMRFSRDTADNLTNVTVVFWEPVTGVEAGDLTVDGSAATSVESSMGGRRYTFTGFATPDPCNLDVRLSGANVTDADGQAFDGASWSYPQFDHPLPNGTGTAAPTDPDGDCAYEDVDGDGEVTTADALELAFVDLDLVESEFAADQVAALDFDGDGDLDFDDAVALAADTGVRAEGVGRP